MHDTDTFHFQPTHSVVLTLTTSVTPSQAKEQATPVQDPAVLEKKMREAEEARLAELRAHGTPVTREAFAKWKEAFEAENAVSEAALGEEQRMTGKRFFQIQESRHADVDETPSGSDEEGWDQPAAPEAEDEEDAIDYDDEDSSDDDALLDQLAADRGR